jgi:hypothetical protein
MPEIEKLFFLLQQGFAYLGRSSNSFGYLNKISFEVRPAQLPAMDIHPVIGRATITGDRATKSFAQNRLSSTTK